MRKEQMIGFIKNIFRKQMNDEEKEILRAIEESELKTMRVVGRGTLVVDPKEVSSQPKFKEYALKAKRLVESENSKCSHCRKCKTGEIK